MGTDINVAEQLTLIVGLVMGMGIGALLGYLFASGRVQSKLALEKRQDHQQQAEQDQLLQQQLLALKEKKIELETLLQAKSAELDYCQASLQEREQNWLSLQDVYRGQTAQLASLKTELDQERKVADEKLKDLQEARQQLNQDFEVLANRIFDDKTERFNKNSKITLDSALNPLREQLTDFKQKVEDVYDKDSKERLSLVAELAQLKQLNLQMSSDALNLTNALKGDNKVQGNWGEVILERVLEESGLHKGREYETQVSLKSEQGFSRPDVIVHLPENKDIVIDSKVSLVHYERYCNSDVEDDRQQALKAHVASVREHIKGLSVKNYESLEGLRSLDFVFIFIPIESAFMAAFEHDQALFKDAYEKNIIVVGPTTLLATLRTVQSIWRYERQNKHAEEIARQAGAMHDKFVAFVNDLEKISEHLEKANLAHSNAMNKLATGRGNLVSSTQRLEKLGAKVKKSMPASVVDSSADIEQVLGLEPEELEQKTLAVASDSETH